MHVNDDFGGGSRTIANPAGGPPGRGPDDPSRYGPGSIGPSEAWHVGPNDTGGELAGDVSCRQIKWLNAKDHCRAMPYSMLQHSRSNGLPHVLLVRGVVFSRGWKVGCDDELENLVVCWLRKESPAVM